MKKILLTAILALSFVITTESFAQISPPTLQTPPNGATGVSTTPLFNWTDVSGATSYSIQVITGITTVINVGGLALSQYQVTTPPLQENTQYYWRAAAVNGTDTAWSGYFNFTTTVSIPLPPVLSLPPDNATNVSVTPTFEWNPSAGAATYHIQVSTDVSFTNPTINVSGLTSTQYVASPPLANGTLYYWRVRATNIGGTSDWSAVWSFSTVPAPPPPPNLLAPPNGATGISLTPGLDWSDVFGATSYHLQVSTSPGFSTLIIDVSALGVSGYSVPAGVLSGGTTYYWHVASANVGGEGAYSATFNFTTQQGLPAAPQLLTPLDNAVNIPRNPFFDWNDVASATSYRIQVATDPGFGSLIINEVTSSSQYQAEVNALLNNTSYYWRVNATNSTGDGPWSAVRTFMTVSEAPLPPVLVSPPNNATNISLTVTLDWDASASATSYTVQVATNTNFNSPVVNINVTATQYQIPSGTLIGNTIYYWRVSATNPGGTSAYSDTWQFTTIQTLTSNLKVYLEGFYNGSVQVRDTVKVYLANSTTPFTINDSSRVYLDENGIGTVSFEFAPNGNYYIVIKHRNHLETWSALPQFFQTGNIVNYDFTTGSNKAYGNNMKQVGSSWVLWGGDITQDGSVDPTDYNAYIPQFGKDGYISSDLNGDNYADGYDLPILYNNFGKSRARP
jgi:hypothetical protein